MRGVYFQKECFSIQTSMLSSTRCAASHGSNFFWPLGVLTQPVKRDEEKNREAMNATSPAQNFSVNLRLNVRRIRGEASIALPRKLFSSLRRASHLLGFVGRLPLALLSNWSGGLLRSSHRASGSN
jgi:hypothetical protein